MILSLIENLVTYPCKNPAAKRSPDAGTLTFWGQAGSGVVGSYDDKMPTAYEESFDGADGPGRGHSSSNMFYYTNNSVEGVAIDVSYTPSGGDSSKEGSMEFGVVLTAKC